MMIDKNLFIECLEECIPVHHIILRVSSGRKIHGIVDVWIVLNNMMVIAGHHVQVVSVLYRVLIVSVVVYKQIKYLLMFTAIVIYFLFENKMKHMKFFLSSVEKNWISKINKNWFLTDINFILLHRFTDDPRAASWVGQTHILYCVTRRESLNRKN